MNQQDAKQNENIEQPTTPVESNEPTWPDVERRSGNDRRSGDDRRQNLRYGRRKGKTSDRRLNAGDRRSS